MIDLDIRLTRDTATPELAQLVRMPQRFASAIARGLQQGAWEVLGRAIKERFTGGGSKPFPVSQHRLRRISGHLAQSLRVSDPQINTTTGDISISLGSNVNYFAVHEFGGRFNIPGHTRRRVAARFNTNGTLTKSTISRRLENAGRRNAMHVRAHKRTVPARAPLGTALMENRSRYQISLAINREIRAEIRGGLATA